MAAGSYLSSAACRPLQGCPKTAPPEQVMREGDGEKGKRKPLSLCNLNSGMMSYSCHVLLDRHSRENQAWAHPEVSVAGACLDVHRDTVLYSPSHGRLWALMQAAVTVSTWACVWMPGSRSLPRSHYSRLQDQDHKQHQLPDFQPGSDPEPLTFVGR